MSPWKVILATLAIFVGGLITGVVLVAKRLENGKFSWPAIDNGVMRLSAAQLQALLEGLDWRRVHEARRTRVPAEAS